MKKSTGRAAMRARRMAGAEGVTKERSSIREACRTLAACLASGAAATAPAAFAQAAPGADAAAAPATQQVVVTATRTEAAAFDVPASIDRVDGDALRDGRAATGIAEGLAGVPGLLARDRQNFAQDVQLSLRGFGARSSFGIRGVRLYVDGLPATFPDGQGRVSQIDLESVDRVEVLRGPFSAMYGNSSGGVVQVFSENGGGPLAGEATVAAGSNGLWRESLKASGGAGPLDFSLSGTHFRTDGPREHSAAERTLGHGKFTWHATRSDTLTLVLDDLHAPLSQDPLGLTRAQFDADPRSTDPAAIAFDTRKSLDQRQAGVLWDHRFDGGSSLRALAYDGWRRTVQFQSIPVASQAAPSNAGGVIDLGTRYRGAEVSGTWRGQLAGGPASLVAGVSLDDMDQHRRGYENYVETPDGVVTGVEGGLRRDENDLATAVDEFAQAEWRPLDAWSLSAGLRHSRVRFDSRDHYVVLPGNGDDSGKTTYAATLPVLGVMFRATPRVHLYATAGRGFETPTYNELAYRPDGTPGLNFALRPARSTNVEVGAKWRDGQGSAASVAVFRTRTLDEIVTLTNTGGRSTYQNAGATRRDGVEAELSLRPAAAWRWQSALTLIDARYTRDFVTCNTSPCPASKQVTVTAGHRLPGVPWATLDTALDWVPSAGWRAGGSLRAMSATPVDDRNSDAARGFVVFGLHASRTWQGAGGRWTPFVRVDNLFDQRYAGSVIVNEGNGRFFEPAPGRTFVVGVTAAFGGV